MNNTTAAPRAATSLIDALHDRVQFIVYKLVPGESGRTDKIPVHPETLRSVDAHDHGNWLRGDRAAQYADYLNAFTGSRAFGVGVVLFKDCGIAAIDIDHALVEGKWSPLAHEICARFSGAYTEVSPSGTGLHIFFAAREIPPHKKKNVALAIEFYSELRFLTVTGTNAIGSVLFDATHLLPKLIADYFQPSATAENAEWTDAPLWPVPGTADDAECISKMRAHRSPGAIFGDKASTDDLWTGNLDALAKAFPSQSTSKHYDASSADQALANHLVWWTGGDCARTERLMRESALMRDKWDSRPDYLRATILDALSFAAKNPPKDLVTAGTAEPAKKKPQIPAPPVPTAEDPRPVVLLSGGKFDQYAEQAEELIADAIYVRGDNLVRIGRAADISKAIKVRNEAGTDLMQDATGTKRDASQAVCIPASPGWMRRELMKRAQFWKYDKRSMEWEPRDCPKEIAENIGDQEAWLTFRPLVTISSVPFLRPDMSVGNKPGYDAATGIYYQPTIEFPVIIARPTREDALQALARLWEPVAEFPFASPEAKAVCLSHILTAVLRPSFDTSPVFFYTAPAVANGKTLLSSIPSIIAYGAPAAQHPYSEKEELRKVLFASLLAGDMGLIFDNVPNGIKVRAAVLCGFVTAADWGDRILGVSEIRKIPNRCTVGMTGNNITPYGDLARRSIVSRLDVNAESARGRIFRIRDLRSFVREHRAQYIVDVLTIARAYAFAGYPEVAHPLESFEQWSRVVRDPIVWLGTADPVKSQETETENEVEPLQDAFAAIAVATQHLGHKFTAAQLAPLTIAPPLGVMRAPGESAASLRDVLIGAGCLEPADAVRLGYWLREHKDRVSGGWKLKRAGERNGAPWVLVEITRGPG